VTQFELPDNLKTLERDLALALPSDPPASLRDRVLRSHDEVTMPLREEETRSRRRLALVAILAGVVLVWMNLSLVASNAIDLEARTATTVNTSPETERQLAMLDELISDLDESQNQSLTILLHSRRTTDVSRGTLLQNLPTFK